MKNIFHAEMALLIRREREIEEKLRELSKDLGLWKDRVELAHKTDRDELAHRAEERLASIRTEARELRDELSLTKTKKKRVRYESRRPTGESLARAEAMVESFRQSGLVDPDEADLQAEFDGLSSGSHSEENQSANQPEPNSAETARPAEKSPPSPAEKSSFDDLDLDDLENLDIDELERLAAGKDLGEA